MSIDANTYREILKEVEAFEPLILEAMADVDLSLLDAFGRLSIPEKIERASQTARTLQGFRHANG